MGRSSSLVRTLALRCSNDVDPNHTLMLDFYEFDQWLKQKYADSYRVTVLCYARRYSHLVVADNLRDLDMLPS